MGSFRYDKPTDRGKAEKCQGRELSSLEDSHSGNSSEDTFIVAEITGESPLLLNANLL